ncbi:MAG: hypothetical protein AAF580_18500 [Pseudomonadota bacterium]
MPAAKGVSAGRDHAPAADADETGFVSMADLLIGTTATLLLVVLALAPQLGTVVRTEPAATIPALSAADAPVLLAADRRLKGFGNAAGIDVGLDDIPALSMDPTRLPLLVIGEGGQEAAFLTEARLSALGFGTVRRVRLPAQCLRIIAVGNDSISCE